MALSVSSITACFPVPVAPGAAPAGNRELQILTDNQAAARCVEALRGDREAMRRYDRYRREHTIELGYIKATCADR